jgi:hypothetical protein
MTTNVCNAKFKCRIWLDNYKYFISRHVSKHFLYCVFKLVLFWSWRDPLKKIKTIFFHLHHVNISICTAILQNTTKFGFVHICTQKKVEECICRVPTRSWILGIYYSFVGL